MGLIANIKNFMAVNDELDDEQYVQEEEVVADKRETYSSSIGTRDSFASKSKYVDLQANSNLYVVLVKPESFNECKEIADHLNQKRTVVLNLESASKDISRRIVDFLSGAAYANHGTLKRVANSTFIITPDGVGVSGDELLDDFSESNGIYI